MLGAAPKQASDVAAARTSNTRRRVPLALASTFAVLAGLLLGAVGAGASTSTESAVPAPSQLSVAATTQTSISVSWSASTGDRIFRIYRSSTWVGATASTGYTITGLTCGTTYTVSIVAVGAGEQLSAATSATAATQSCSDGTTTTTKSPPPTTTTTTTSTTTTTTKTGVDTTPPTVPARLATSGVGQTSVTLSWTASTDNVGVSGYRLYRAGTAAGTSSTTSYTFSGLTCATSYTVGVSAFDAAGNASAQASTTVTTSACSTVAGQPASSGTASLWVSPSGSSSCVRAGVPVGFAAALAGGNVCDSGPTAYVRAQLGDTVLVQGGTYTTPWNFVPLMSKAGSAGSCNYNYGGSASLAGCVSFVAAPSQSVVFQVAGTNVSAIRICADFVSIRGITINQTTYTDQFGDTVSNGSVTVGAGDNTCQPGGAPPHDIYLSNITYGGQASATGGAFNVWFVGGTATSTSDFPWQMGGQGNNGGTGYANHNGIVGIVFQGGSFADTDPAHHHMECVHDTPGSDHIVIASSRFISCPVESFFAQGNSQTNILVENNYFIGGGPLKFDCTTNPGCVNQNITVRYNSFQSATLLLQNACNKNGTCSGAVIDNNVITSNAGLPSCITVGFGLSGSSGSGWMIGGLSVLQCTSVSSTTTTSTTSKTTTTSTTSTTSTAPMTFSRLR